MGSLNIKYKSSAISEYYSNNRLTWDELYLSEKTILKKININVNNNVLDIGCGCGGLGLALKERFAINNYTGIDINESAISSAKKINPQGRFLAGDILEINKKQLEKYDLVTSLGCIDWNIEFDRMLKCAMYYVKPGGIFLSSFRFANKDLQNTQKDSYQYINFENKQEGEKAPYIILDINDLFKKILVFNPSKIMGYGYWGKPSFTAVTEYKEVCFTVIAVKKGMNRICDFDLELPKDLIINNEYR